jgi:hypothetical protein
MRYRCRTWSMVASIVACAGAVAGCISPSGLDAGVGRQAICEGDVAISERPAVGWLRFRNTIPQAGCTATLITPTHILTAAHCTNSYEDDLESYTFHTRVGAELRSSGVDDYWDAPDGTDVAVMHLSDPQNIASAAELESGAVELYPLYADEHAALEGMSLFQMGSGWFCDPPPSPDADVDIEECAFIKHKFEHNQITKVFSYPGTSAPAFGTAEGHCADGDSGGPGFVSIEGIDVIAGVVWTTTRGEEDFDRCQGTPDGNSDSYVAIAGDIREWLLGVLGDAYVPDADRDGVLDEVDVCVMVPDPEQRDSDGDGQGDACEEEDFAALEGMVPLSGDRAMCTESPWPLRRTSGDVYELTYRTYLERSEGVADREPCQTTEGDFDPLDTHPDTTYLKRRPVQLRWCSCQNTTSLAKSLPNDHFFTQEETSLCAAYYCPTGGDPTEGQNFENRVGWYAPTHHSEPDSPLSLPSVSSATLTYPDPDQSVYDLTTPGFHIVPRWLETPVDTSSSSEGEHHVVDETLYFSGPAPSRRFAPYCATTSDEAREQEDDFHRRTLRWRWSDEFMPVPGGGDYGAQAKIGGFHKVMFWLRTDPENAEPDEQNTFVYPDDALEVHCTLAPFLFEVGMLRMVVRPGDPETESHLDRRVFAGVEVMAGYGQGYEDYLYPSPVGQRALTEGLVIHPYSPASDLFDQPLPSEFTQGSKQMEGRGLRMVELGPEQDRELMAYGGAYADGTYERGLWLGSVNEQASVVSWTGPIVPTGAPVARAEAVLLLSPASVEKSVMFGGRYASGLRADLWTYNRATNLWTQLAAKGTVPSARAEVGFVQSSDLQRAFLFGGRITNNGLSGELFMLDLTTNSFQRLWQGGAGGPAARRGASVELDEVYGRLLVFGGFDASGPRNDLWSFDLTNKTWELLSATCQPNGATCPPPAQSTALVLDRWSHRLRVLPGYSTTENGEPSWTFAPGEGWTHFDTTAQDQTGDCDGDGERDDGHGVLCQSTAQWWAPLGTWRCGTAGLVCSTPQFSGAVVDMEPVSGAREMALVGDAALVLGTQQLRAIDLTIPGAPVAADSIVLNGTGMDLVVGDEMVYVAAGPFMDAVDVTDPLAPVKTGDVQLFQAIQAVTLVGSDTVAAATSKGISVIDVGDPFAPTQVSYLWLRYRTGYGWETALDNGTMTPPWPGTFGWTGPGALEAVGTLAVLAAQGDLLVFDVSNPATPALLGSVPLGHPIDWLRAAGDEVYAATASQYGNTGPVVDVTFPGAPEEVYEHVVGEWVRGADVRDAWAYRVVSSGLQVAQVEPAQ